MLSRGAGREAEGRAWSAGETIGCTLVGPSSASDGAAWVTSSNGTGGGAGRLPLARGAAGLAREGTGLERGAAGLERGGAGLSSSGGISVFVASTCGCRPPRSISAGISVFGSGSGGGREGRGVKVWNGSAPACGRSARRAEQASRTRFALAGRPSGNLASSSSTSPSIAAESSGRQELGGAGGSSSWLTRLPVSIS